MGLTRLDCVQSSGLLFLGCQPLSCLRAFVHTVPSIWTSYSFFFTSWTPAYASHLCSNITSSDPQASLGPATMCPEVTFWFFLLSIDQLVCMHAKLLQSCLTLCGTMDRSPPASSVHGILQAGKLEWVAMPSCSGSSQTRDRTCVSYVSCTGRQVLYH